MLQKWFDEFAPFQLLLNVWRSYTYLSSWGGSSPAVWTGCLCFSLVIFCLQLGRWKGAGKKQTKSKSNESSQEILSSPEGKWQGSPREGKARRKGSTDLKIFSVFMIILYNLGHHRPETNFLHLEPSLLFIHSFIMMVKLYNADLPNDSMMV